MLATLSSLICIAMTNIETEFAVTSSGFDASDPYANSENANQYPAAGTEKDRHISTAQNDTPIIYHYLTFETELPPPSVLVSSDHNTAPPPEPSDLRNHVSPFTWSASRKRWTTWLSCAVTVLTAYTAGSYSFATAAMSEEWGVSAEDIYVGITTFTTGFATAPMVLAPFSEINGRYPVFVATGVCSILWEPDSFLAYSSLGIVCYLPALLWSYSVICGDASRSILYWGRCFDIQYHGWRSHQRYLPYRGSEYGHDIVCGCCSSRNRSRPTVFRLHCSECKLAMGFLSSSGQLRDVYSCCHFVLQRDSWKRIA